MLKLLTIGRSEGWRWRRHRRRRRRRRGRRRGHWMNHRNPLI